MDDTKQTDEHATAAQPEPSKKPIAEQMTDLLATAAGALAEGAVRSVAKHVRKTAAKKAPAPIKKAAQGVANAAKRPKRAKKSVQHIASKKAAKKAKRPKKAASKKPSKKAQTRAKKSTRR